MAGSGPTPGCYPDNDMTLILPISRVTWTSFAHYPRAGRCNPQTPLEIPGSQQGTASARNTLRDDSISAASVMGTTSDMVDLEREHRTESQLSGVHSLLTCWKDKSRFSSMDGGSLPSITAPVSPSLLGAGTFHRLPERSRARRSKKREQGSLPAHRPYSPIAIWPGTTRSAAGPPSFTLIASRPCDGHSARAAASGS
jgi:hypothetical protein